MAINRGIAVHLGSDSQAMIDVANKLIRIAEERIERHMSRGMTWAEATEMNRDYYALGKPWGLVPNGDAWLPIWRTIKPNRTQCGQVQEGQSTPLR